MVGIGLAPTPSRAPLRLQPLGEPIADIGDADRQIIALAVLVAALFEGEHLESLVLGADRGKQCARVFHGDLRVALPVRQQIRALHLLGDAGETEAFELLERAVDIVDAEHPHMMCSPGTESEAWNAFSTRFFQVA